MPTDKITDDAFDDGPLSQDERRQLRRLLEEDRRRRWLRKQTLTLAAWLTAVIVAITTFSEGAKKMLRILLGA